MNAVAVRRRRRSNRWLGRLPAALIVLGSMGALSPASSQSLGQGPAPATTAPGGWSTSAAKPIPDAAKTKPNVKVRKSNDIPGTTSHATITSASVSTENGRTSLALDMTTGVRAEVYTLANPYRVVIDMPDVAFRLPDAAGQHGKGLIKAFRYGLFAPGKARIVADTSSPVRIEKAAMTSSGKGAEVRFQVTLAPMDSAAFGDGTGAEMAHNKTKPSLHEDPGALAAAAPKHRPVVLIDPGHGGVDPGAVSKNNVYEKNVVLAVAKQLRATLAASGRYDVILTRDTDVFVPLDQRRQISYEKRADLFISLHADSIDAQQFAGSIRGASVYVLSDRASDEEARRMAEKENASDVFAGGVMSDSGEDDQVKNILIDLLKRETANFSADFSRMLIGRLSKSASLNKGQQRAAAFKVLRQTHAPSVLLELGYMSNDEDEKLLSSPVWQKQIAGSIAAAVDQYFSSRTSRAP